VKQGQQSFRAGDYEAAVKSFRGAESVLDSGRLVVPPVLYRSMARCYDQMGQIVAARALYKRFLSGADPGSRALKKAIKQAKEADERLSRVLEGTRLTFDVSPDGTEVHIDRRDMGVTPLEPVRVSPGPHAVTLWAEGHEPVTITVDVAPGATIPIIMSLLPSSTKEAKDSASSESTAGRAPALAAIGVGVALLLGAGWCLSHGNGLEADGDALVEAAESDGLVTGGELVEVQDLYDEAGRDRGAALILGAGGAAALVAGWWLWPAERDMALRFGVGPAGAATAQMHLRW
jgi:hypothetical protein